MLVKDISKGERKKLTFLGLAGLVLLGLLIYSNILHAPFVFDDRGTIAENESIRHFSKAVSHIEYNRYIGFASFAFNYAIGGLHVVGYHIINNLVHVINALLVYFFASLLAEASRPGISDFSRLFVPFSAAFLFIAHPIQTQAVTYISQRFTSLATMFYLLSLIFYIKARLSYILQAKESNRSRPLFSKTTVLFYAGSLFSVALAMKSKEIALTIPLAIALCERYFFWDKDSWKGKLIFLSPVILFLLIIPAGFIVTDNSLARMASGLDAASRETTIITRLNYGITQIRVIVTYLRLLILPYNQNLDYDYQIYNTVLSPEVFSSLVLLLVIAFIAVITYRPAKLVSFGIVWFFLALSVESSLIPIRDVINEHRVYLPSIGFFIASVSALDQLVSKKYGKIALVAVLVFILAVSAYNRNKIWKDPELLWEDVLVKAPDNARAYNNLGTLLKEKGEYDKAVMLFEKSLRSNKNYTAVYYNLGDIEYRRGNYENALNYLNRALTGKRDRRLSTDILNKLGRTYGALGQTEKAIEMYKKGLELSPASIVLLNNLGVQYIKDKQIDEAIETYERAIKIREEDYLFLNLATAYYQKGNYQKSDLSKQRAFELQQRK